jgi:hypothetical protein
MRTLNRTQLPRTALHSHKPDYVKFFKVFAK